MKVLLDKDNIPGKATRSPFEDGLEYQGGSSRTRDVAAFSKLGLLTIKVSPTKKITQEYDAAYIERDQGSTRLKYVAIGLTAPNTRDIHKLALEIDACIVANQP
jgi:hypothetical protein